MKKFFPFLLMITALLVVTLACQLGTPDPATLSSGTTMFEDDYSSKAGKWDETTDEHGSTNYANDAYQMLVTSDNFYIWANPGTRTFTDVRVEVDAVKSAGDDLSDAGLICRYIDEGNFYMGVITLDGSYVIMKLSGGDMDYLGMDEMGYNPSAIKSGGATNHIRLDCVGSTITLYANGVQLAQVTDSTFTEGNVGLVAGTWDTPGTIMTFDNFKVFKP